MLRIAIGMSLALVIDLWAPSAIAMAADEPVIEGDADLLDVIHAAQLTSEAQFERGRLVAEIHDEALMAGLHSHSVVTVFWDGENTYLDAEFHFEHPKDAAAHDFSDPDARIEDSEKDILDSRLIAIGTPHMVCRYKPDARSVTIEWRTDGLRLMPIFQARPDQNWIVNFRAEGNLFSHAFDRTPPNPPERFVVQPEDDDRVRVERYYEGFPPAVAIVSMQAGLRVVESRRVLPADPMRKLPTVQHEARYQWEQLPDGSWVVRELEQTSSYPEIADMPFSSFRMTLREYDPDPEIPADQFKVEGLGLPDGTSVTELRGSRSNLQQRNYTIGESGKIPQELLDSLADELNESGFGREPGDGTYPQPEAEP
jgi:hypothetical protein